MKKAVIFDMFETLITHYHGALYFGTEMAADAGIKRESFLKMWRATEYDRTIGKVTVEEVVANILHEHHCYSEELLTEIIGKRIAAKEACFEHLHKEIIPLFSELKKKGIRIGLISNCFSEEAKVIRKSELFPYFDTFYLSYEQGMAKPEEEIFQRCIRELQVEAGECLYVGDGGDRELETAHRLGMTALQAVWYEQEYIMESVRIKKDFPQMKNPLQVLNYL